MDRGKTKSSQVWRKRLRQGAWTYLVLVVLMLYVLLYATSNAVRVTSVEVVAPGATSTSVFTREIIGGLDPSLVASTSGVVLLWLLLIGVIFVITVSFLKRHWVAGVMGALTLLMGTCAATGPSPPDSPELGIVWAALGPLLLLLVVIFPVIGAIRSAKPGSRWAIYFLTAEPDDNADLSP